MLLGGKGGPAKSIAAQIGGGGGSVVSIHMSYIFYGDSLLQYRNKVSYSNSQNQKQKLDPKTLLGVLISHFMIAL